MKNKIAILFLLATIIVITSSLVLGAIVIQNATANSNWTGTMFVNVSFVNSTDILWNASKTNATWYFNGSGTYVVIGTANMTCVAPADATGTGSCNQTIDISGVTDNKGTLNVTIISEAPADITLKRGATEANDKDGIWIDNTDPVVKVETDINSINLNKVFQYTTEISDAASTVETMRCIITDPGLDVTDIGENESSFSFNGNKVGTYNVSCSATDYAGNERTNSTAVTVKKVGTIVEEPVGEGAGFNWKIVLYIGIAIGVGYLLTRKK